VWQEITLTTQEEQEVEDSCRRENLRVMDECLEDAKNIAIKHGVNTEDTQTSMGIALFEKRASHVVFWKESKAKEKFDSTS